MKKILYSVLALGAIATLASCSSEEPLGPNDRPNDGKVTFNVALPDMGTRAFGDASTINCNELKYTVYDAAGSAIILPTATVDAFGEGVLNDDVTLQLVANESYKIVFYAHNNTSNFSSYQTTAEGAKLSVNYGTNHVNSELDDAFYAVYDFVADGNAKNVTLKRPFAQINIGTDDLDNEAVKKILANVTSKLTVNNGLCNSMNLLTGKTEVKGSLGAVTFTPQGEPKVNGDFPYQPTKYSNLLSAYLLVPAEQDIIEATYVITNEAKVNAPKEIRTLNLSGTPVQMNYRTNIYGSLLTTENQFNVTIVPGFDDEINQVIPGKGEILMNGQKYNSLQDAITAAAATESKSAEIALGAGNWDAKILGAASDKLTNLSLTGVGDATVIQNYGGYHDYVTVANANIKFTNLKIVMPNADYVGFAHTASASYENCTIQNKIFLYGGTETFTRCKFINNNDYNVWTYGAANVTFKDCSFGEYGKAILIYHEAAMSANINIIGCTFNGTAVEGKAAIEIDGTFTNGGEGLYTVNIDNCTVNGYAPGSVSGSNIWNVKKGENAKVTLNGTVVFPQP